MSESLISYSRYYIFTNIKNDVSNYFSNKQKPINIHFTTEDKSDSTAQFPTVFIKYNDGSEKGKTLELEDINGFENNVEVHVTVSEYQKSSLAYDIMERIAYLLRKNHGISCVGVPHQIQTSNKTIKLVARFRNIIT